MKAEDESMTDTTEKDEVRLDGERIREKTNKK